MGEKQKIDMETELASHNFEVSLSPTPIARPTIPAIQLLLKYLEAEGVEYIFGIPGGPLMPIYEALKERNVIKPILAKHEEGAAFMADGYARMRHGLGVCCVTTGPGATNAVTGIAAAYADGVPVMIITAQVATSAFGRGAFQETTSEYMSVVDLFKPITKASMMLMRADKMGETVRHLLRIAMSGQPGPVHLNIPADLARKMIPDEPIDQSQYKSTTHVFDREAVKKAAQALIRAKRPAILAGNGVNSSGAHSELRQLSEKLSIPVATTVKGKSTFPEDHILSVGVFGFAGSPRAEACLLSGNVDVLLTVGTSLGEMETNGWDPHLKPQEALLQLDVDQQRIGANYSADIPLIGDAKTVLREILFQIEREMKWMEDKNERHLSHIKELRRKHPWCVDEEKMLSNDIPMKPQRLMYELGEALPQESVVFVDIGNSMSWAFHYLRMTRPYSFFHAIGLGPMGFGVVASIGAKFANPKSPVIALVGDAAFLMNGNEIHTACEYGVPVVWVVQNNGGHGMIYHGEKVQFGGKFHNSLFKQPVNFVAFARSLGAEGYIVDRPEEFGGVFRKALGSGKPTVIDVRIDLQEMPPIGSRFKALNRYFDDREQSSK